MPQSQQQSLRIATALSMQQEAAKTTRLTPRLPIFIFYDEDSDDEESDDDEIPARQCC